MYIHIFFISKRNSVPVLNLVQLLSHYLIEFVPVRLVVCQSERGKYGGSTIEHMTSQCAD